MCSFGIHLQALSLNHYDGVPDNQNCSKFYKLAHDLPQNVVLLFQMLVELKGKIPSIVKANPDWKGEARGKIHRLK